MEWLASFMYVTENKFMYSTVQEAWSQPQFDTSSTIYLLLIKQSLEFVLIFHVSEIIVYVWLKE